MRKLNNDDDGTKPRNGSSAESADTRKRLHGEEVADAGCATQTAHDDEQARLEREVREAAEALIHAGAEDLSRHDQAVEDDAPEPEFRFLLAPPDPPRMDDVFPGVQQILDRVALKFTVQPPIPAASLLALLSCLVGLTRRINVIDFQQYGNLWIVIVASSGVGKSPVMDFFFSRVWEIEADLAELWEEELREYTAAGKEEQKHLKVPKLRQLCVDDTTLEALSGCLKNNPRGLMWYADEISGMLASFDKYNKNGQGGETKSRLMRAFNCGPWRVNRADQTRNVVVPHAYISIFGGLQPEVLKTAFNAAHDQGSGFLPRFILVRAERVKASRLTHNAFPQECRQLLDRIVDGIWRFKMVPGKKGRPMPVEVHVTEEAEKAYLEWHDRLSDDLLGIMQAGECTAWGEKLKEYCMRIALLFHCMKAAIEGTDGTEPVEEPIMRLAIRYANWISESQAQLIECLRDKPRARAMSRLDLLLAEEIVTLAKRQGGFPVEVTSAQFAPSLSKKLGVPVSSTMVGHAMNRIGIPKSFLRRREGVVYRARLISRDVMRPYLVAVRDAGKR